MLGIGRVVGCGCRSGKWVRAEGCYNWQLRGGRTPPNFGKKLGQVLDFLLAGLGNLRSWQVLGFFRVLNLAGFRFFVGSFRKSEKLAGLRF